jgi:hypothetical protein
MEERMESSSSLSCIVNLLIEENAQLKRQMTAMNERMMKMEERMDDFDAKYHASMHINDVTALFFLTMSSRLKFICSSAQPTFRRLHSINGQN